MSLHGRGDSIGIEINDNKINERTCVGISRETNSKREWGVQNIKHSVREDGDECALPDEGTKERNEGKTDGTQNTQVGANKNNSMFQYNGIEEFDDIIVGEDSKQACNAPIGQRRDIVRRRTNKLNRSNFTRYGE